MRRNTFAKAAAAAFAAALALTSCLSTGPKMTPDEKAVAKGVEAWNKRSPQAAKPYWTEIKDSQTRDKRLGYVEKAVSAQAAVDGVDPEKPSDAQVAAAFDKAVKAYSPMPEELPPPPALKAKALALGELRMRSLIKADRWVEASEAGKEATRLFGPSRSIDSMDKEIEAVRSSRKDGETIDAKAEAVRAMEDFDAKVKAFEGLAADCAEARSRLLSASKANGVADAQIVLSQAQRLKQKGQGFDVEKETMIRDAAYAYRDRIGEEFARVPEGEGSGAMSLEELLAYQESVRANVDAAYKDLIAFAERYPDAVDRDFLDEVLAQKKDLDAKIAQVEAEIRTAKEIASRGKVVFPVIIGLFNSQPIGKDEAKKSRPAAFGAKGAKKAEYWWGMYSIPRNAMNDLVITMKDGRGVRVFGENTKSGKLVGKNGIVDLVNKGSKAGNSWPVLNAGKAFPTDKYFFEIEEGKTDAYEGEVVVYSSFIVRMR